MKNIMLYIFGSLYNVNLENEFIMIKSNILEGESFRINIFSPFLEGKLNSSHRIHHIKDFYSIEL